MPGEIAIAAPATPIPALARARNPLVLWHLLSLDAPTVAVVWLLFIARTTHTSLPPVLPLTLFLAVWLIYTFDRLLDARQFDPHPLNMEAPPETAHRFHRTHRLAFTLTAALATVLIALLLPALPGALLGRYLLLATALFLWLLLIHFTALQMPKAYAPGLFFAAAIFLPVLQSQPLTTLLPQAAMFAALGILNCLYIQLWERPSRPIPNVLSYVLIVVPLLLPSPFGFAIALAAAALRLLSTQRTRIHPVTLRAAADLALLTPLLFFTLTR